MEDSKKNALENSKKSVLEDKQGNVLKNKKGQGMVVDLILLIIITSIFFLFLSGQSTEQSIESGVARAQSAYVQKLLISTLNYKIENKTISEITSMNYCGESEDLNNNIHEIMNKLNKPNYYFIYSVCPENNCKKPEAVGICSDRIEEKYNCCVKTEKINVASITLDLPSGCEKENLKIYLGIWPKSMDVESCE